MSQDKIHGAMVKRDEQYFTGYYIELDDSFFSAYCDNGKWETLQIFVS